MSSLKDIRHFFLGMNLDDDWRTIQDGEYGKGRNCLLEATEDGSGFVLKNRKGTLQIPFQLPAGLNKSIGWCVDAENKAIITFVWNSNSDHCITRLFTETGVIEAILYAEPVLNFQENQRINCASVLDGLDYFTDGYDSGNGFLPIDYNSPRKINIEKAIKYTNGTGRYDVLNAFNYGTSEIEIYLSVPVPSDVIVGDNVHLIDFFTGANLIGKVTTITPFIGVVNIIRILGQLANPLTNGYIYTKNAGYYLPFTVDDISVAKSPPTYPPLCSYGSDSTYTHNNLKNNLWQFCYRYIYDDNEESVYSPFSKVELPIYFPTLLGEPDALQNNVIFLTYNTGSPNVKTIELYARGQYRTEDTTPITISTNFADYYKFATINKVDESNNPLVTSNIVATIGFYNDKTDTLVLATETYKISTFVPQVARQQEIISRNRLIYGDITENYDYSDVNLQLNRIPIIETPVYSDLVIRTLPQSTDTYSDNYDRYNMSVAYMNVNLSSITNAEIGMYLDVSVTWDYGSGLGYIGGNYGTVLLPNLTASTEIMLQDISDLSALSGRIVAQLLSIGDYNRLMWGLPDLDMHIFNNPTTYINFFYQFFTNLYTRSTWNMCNPQITARIIKRITKATFGSFGFGKYIFGIAHYDTKSRYGNVSTNDNCSLTFPAITETTLAGQTTNQYLRYNVEWNISNKPPDWADTWALVCTMNTSLSGIESYIYDVVNDASIDSYANLQIKINNQLVNYTKKDNLKNIVNPYTFKTGDRIVFIAKYASSIFTPQYFTRFIEYEIDGWDAANNAIVIKDFDTTAGFYGTQSYKWISVVIYSPKLELTEKTFYEIGEKYPISDPHTPQRAYGGQTQNQDYLDPVNTPAKGVLQRGDIYERIRTDTLTTYLAYSFNFSDNYISKVTDIGKPHIQIKTSKRKRYISLLEHSGTYFEGTQINDLSVFEASWRKSLSERYGRIVKIKERGQTLQVIHELKSREVDIEVQALQSADGSSIPVQSTGLVFGNVRERVTNYGSNNTESFGFSNNYIYFFDIHNGCFVRNSTNGDEPISQLYKVENFIRENSEIFKIYNTQYHTFEAIGWYNEGLNEYGVLFLCKYLAGYYDQKLSEPCYLYKIDYSFGIIFDEKRNRYISLVDYFIPYTYLLYRGSDIIPYQQGVAGNGYSIFIDNYKFPELFATFGMLTIGYVDGQAYKMDFTTNYNNFFGVQHPLKVEVISGIASDKMKVLDTVALVTNNNKTDLPTSWRSDKIWTRPTGAYPNGMKTRIKQFKFKEERLYKEVGGDLNDTSKINPIANGRPIRGDSFGVELTTDSNNLVTLYSVELGMTPSEKS